MNDDGFIAAVFLVVVALIFFWIGALWTASDVKDECKDFGRTKVLGHTYECRPVEDKP